MPQFKLRNEPPFPKYQISNDLSDVNITKLTRKKGVFRPRGMKELWESFEEREDVALEKAIEIVLGELASEDVEFEFVEMPREYDDFQWMKYSELHAHNRSWTMTYSLGANDVALESRRHSSCIEKDLIWSLFSFEEELSKLLMNVHEYILYRSADGKTISTDFWLTRTGVKGRTKIIETTPVGEKLFWNHTKNFSEAREYEVCLEDGTVIGDISSGGDIDQDEYQRLYSMLEYSGHLKIVKMTLKEVIPHGTPMGRKIKALAKVAITYEIVRDLKRYQMPADYFQGCANAMNVLAKVDYNRKLEIIDGTRPDRYSVFSEIFSAKGRLNDPDCEFLTRQPLWKFKLDSIYMTPLELESFWEVFCSAYHCAKLDSHALDKDTCCGLDVGQFLHHKLYNLSFELEVVEEFNAIGMRILVPYLSLYRNPSSI